MIPAAVSLPTLAEMQIFVRQTLCDIDRLEPEQAKLGQALIQKSGRACGVFYQVQGPRRLRGHAVWAADEGRILFYGNDGSRAGETRLADAPALPKAA